MIKHIAAAASLALAPAFAVAADEPHAAAGREQVRDWKKMDVDGDNYITPKEMMDYMSAYAASQGKAAQHSAAGKDTSSAAAAN